MPDQKTFQKRFVAYKLRICDILDSSFIKDASSAGYITINGVNISRVNIIATIVYKSEDTSYVNAVIDDGSGRIPLRSFESQNTLSKTDVGDIVLVIGKIREFNEEKYIVYEILKKMDNMSWINVRKFELINKKTVNDEIKLNGKDSAQQHTDFYEKIYSMIKKLDAGDGVSADEIVKSFDNSATEKILNKLLEDGNIFEVKPGKLKVLE